MKQFEMMICLDADCVSYSWCPGSQWIHNVQAREGCYTFCWWTSRQRLGMPEPRSEQGKFINAAVSAADFGNLNQLLEWERVIQMVETRVNSGWWSYWEIQFISEADTQIIFFTQRIWSVLFSCFRFVSFWFCVVNFLDCDKEGHSVAVLMQVIVVDWNGESLKLHPRNMLRLPRWKGNDDDQTLVDLGTFLRSKYTSIQSSMCWQLGL
jgi:hypothetical protein